MYAILDIEATGGKKGEEDIIEVAIYKYDGDKVVDQFISLVNPSRNIDGFVQRLTQITPKMVRTAPKFHEIAKRIIEITDGAILVGHNVEFDYRMLKQEFHKLGYSYYRETIDTVPLSEKYFPNANSYSLGKLSKELGIPVSDRHRASGDARATLEIFKLLQDKDFEKDISKFEVSTEKKTSKYEQLYKDLPNSIGLIYFFDENDTIIYLTKSKNIALDVRRKISSKSNLGNLFRMKTAHVKYEITGNELINWIKEEVELQSIKPELNRIIATNQLPYVLDLVESNGYKKIIIKNNKDAKNTILKFTSHNIAQNILSLITEDFELCPLLNEISENKRICLSYQVGECHGACVGAETPESYNQRVKEFLDKVNMDNASFIMIGDGRELGEKSFVVIKDGHSVGYGYFEYHHQINSKKRLNERMIKINPNQIVDSLVKGFLFTEKYKEIIPFKS